MEPEDILGVLSKGRYLSVYCLLDCRAQSRSPKLHLNVFSSCISNLVQYFWNKSNNCGTGGKWKKLILFKVEISTTEMNI